MSITTIVLLVIIMLWSILGEVFFILNRKMVNKAWVNKKYLRCILFSIACGPIAFILHSSFILFTFAKVFTSVLLQEFPDDIERR